MKALFRSSDLSQLYTPLGTLLFSTSIIGILSLPETGAIERASASPYPLAITTFSTSYKFESIYFATSKAVSYLVAPPNLVIFVIPRFFNWDSTLEFTTEVPPIIITFFAPSLLISFCVEEGIESFSTNNNGAL